MPWLLRLYLTYFPFLLTASFYLGWRLISALRFVSKSHTRVRITIIFLLLYFNLHVFLQLIFYWLGFESWLGEISAGHIVWDILFTYPFWFYLIIIVELVPLLVVYDLLAVILRFLAKRQLERWLKLRSVLVLLTTLFLVFYTAGHVVVDNHQILISRKKLVVQDLPENMEGLRIIHISDVQADAHTGKERLAEYIEKVNELKPDLVFFTGDLVTSGTRYIEVGARFMGRLQARLGTYACLGDHDIWADRELVVRALKQQGIPLIENRNISIPVGSDSLLVTVVTNTYAARIAKAELAGLLIQQQSLYPKVFVVHQPTEFLVEAAEAAGYDLFLGGHTHGGQIVLRPLGFTVTPAQTETRFFRGFNRLGQMLISINNGLGYTLAPVRYRAPAEITLIELVGSEFDET
jgi:hypothetical protein